jgi:probable phosphoglycerate mutase
MAVILLVRHGENDYVKKGRLAGRQSGVHLNKEGKFQADRLAENFFEKPIKAIYSSPLDRTMETATPIAKAVGLKVIPSEGLIEVDFGNWEDKKLKKLRKKKRWRIVQSAPSRMCFPKGESFLDAQQRISKELDRIANKHDLDDVVICVSHSDIIKLAIAYFIGMPLDMFQRLHIAPASISALQLGDSFARVLTLNYELISPMSILK